MVHQVCSELKIKVISIFFGTRPEAIKLVPLVLALSNEKKFKLRICVTAQHRQMLDQVLDIFEIMPDVDFSLMKVNQTLSSLTAKVLYVVDDYLKKNKSDMVIVQGDTTTTFATALAAYYNKIPIAHIEAGLRTENKYSPFPEEANRILTSHLADHHFTPTVEAKNNLLREGINADNIYVTGNTVIDTLQLAIEKIKLHHPKIPGISPIILNNKKNKIVLITGHRRENFGQDFESICQAIRKLSQNFPLISFIYPVHLNPNVREPVFRILSGLGNVFLIEPLSYLSFISLMSRAYIILTDSGGIQEEAPALGKPVLVLRKETERPEAVAAGTARLIGTDFNTIVENVSDILIDEVKHNNMAKAVNPYGDGHASERIVGVLKGESIQQFVPPKFKPTFRRLRRQ